jgi:mannitol-1-/sugar-/sorbitol-6-/2-deoxyglucose-6-phosphatase
MTPNKLAHIQAVIFDMDGLLVNSEPLWHIAAQKTFATVGLHLSKADCLLTTGMPTSYIMDYWYSQQPWTGPSPQQLEQQLFVHITELLQSSATAMPGVYQALEYFQNQNLAIGLASASPMPLIEIVLDKLNIRPYFRFYHSALLEKNNKPHPDVYLTVARTMAVPIANCLILEDSVNGVRGAVASGATVIAVPEPHFFDKPEYHIAQYKLASLEAVVNWAQN